MYSNGSTLLAYEFYYEVMHKEKILHRPNKIAAKWLDSKDARKTNRAVQPKHNIARLEEIIVREGLTVRFTVKCYCVTVAYLLNWLLQWRRRKSQYLRSHGKRRKMRRNLQSNFLDIVLHKGSMHEQCGSSALSVSLTPPDSLHYSILLCADFWRWRWYSIHSSAKQQYALENRDPGV